MGPEQGVRAKYRALLPTMDERQRRLWAGAEADVLGRGGVAVVVRATGLARNTVVRGLSELARKDNPGIDRVRRHGAGRKRTAELAPGLTAALERLVEPVTRGDPESALRWTSKSTRHLADELKERDYDVSHKLVAGLLHDLEYSLQANRKTLEGASHPDRNAQFEHINTTVRNQTQSGQPAISVDTKKKELVGRFKNGGREWRPKDAPEKVNVHDFLDAEKRARRSHTACTIFATIWDGSAWVWTMTPQHSLRPRSSAGGANWDENDIRAQSRC